jgi:hypothetical protein
VEIYNNGEFTKEEERKLLDELNQEPPILLDEWYDPISDPEEDKQLFKLSKEPLMKLSGEFGRFFGSHLDRGNFLVIQGPEKSWKSFLLQEMMFYSLKNSLKTMFIGIGDMSRYQYGRRICSRILGKPYKPGDYHYPIGWAKENGRLIGARTRKKKCTKYLTRAECRKSKELFAEKYLGTTEIGSYLRMRCVGGISISEIELWIDRCKSKDEWDVDVLIIDYADRISPPKGIQDKISQIDYNWAVLRNIALDHNCLVISATQTKRSAYHGGRQKREDVSDSKGKTALVTGLVGIGAPSGDYEGYVRILNWVVLRDGDPNRIVTIAGCPAVANPVVLCC